MDKKNIEKSLTKIRCLISEITDHSQTKAFILSELGMIQRELDNQRDAGFPESVKLRNELLSKMR